MASSPGKSITKAAEDFAGVEGAYRFIENDDINAKDIAQAGFNVTAEECLTRRLVLAIEDTTGLSYTHSVCQELGNNPASGDPSTKGRSLFQHSILAMDADTEKVIGLAHQQHFIREEKVKGSGSVLARRPKEEKESYRWEGSSIKMAETFDNTDNVIHVCDREADPYEYMAQHRANNRRFIVRASHDRQYRLPECKMRELSAAPTILEYALKIQQKGNGSVNNTNRPARVAKMGLSNHTVTIKRPHDVDKNKPSELTINLVICRELDDPDEGSSLCWYLYTSEPINNVKEARQIGRYYE
jgi:hypothetical protein